MLISVISDINFNEIHWYRILVNLEFGRVMYGIVQGETVTYGQREVEVSDTNMVDL